MTTTTPNPTPKRLPRYRRTQREAGFVLTARDGEILKLVESYRLATSAQIQALTAGSDQQILRRLQKLFHTGYLDRLAPPTTYGEGSQKMVYAITNKGVCELQKAGLIQNPTQTDWNSQNRTLHTFSVRHMLLVSHIRAVVDLACRTHPPLTLLFWKEGRQIQDAIEVALPEGYVRVPVAPDAFFGRKDAKGRFYCFLEADRGTMTVKRFGLKLKAYAAYWREKKHESTFGIRYFRVLTVTSSAQRGAHLLAAAAKDADLTDLGRMFLFTHEAALRMQHPQSLLETIWTMPHDQGPHSILASGGVEQPTRKEKTPPMQTHTTYPIEVHDGP